MYLSRIMLDASKRKTMLAFSAPNLFHGALEVAFPNERERKLWRIDLLRGAPCLLILTKEKGNFESICTQFGMPDVPAATKRYDPLLARITNNSRWQFRLRANPTYAAPQENGRGKVLAHTTIAHQMQWLASRADKYGFALKADEYQVTESKWYAFRKNGKTNVRMLAVTYEGVLMVTDTARFRQALTQGIGREKAYGMGLLTVASERH